MHTGTSEIVVDSKRKTEELLEISSVSLDTSE